MYTYICMFMCGCASGRVFHLVWVCSSVVYQTIPGWLGQSSRDLDISASHLAIAWGLQMCATPSGLIWLLCVQIQVHMLCRTSILSAQSSLWT